MARITIIGTGAMGTAIGGVLAEGGNDVEHIRHSEVGTAPVTGEIVVLAVPYPALAEIAETYAGQLAGRTVVDISNPLDFETFDSLVVPADGSAAAELQARLPESHVVKAFNTTFAATLGAKEVGGLPTTVLVAGDAAAAKEALAAAVRAGGLTALDAGPLSRARELEAVGFLQLTLAVGELVPWTGGFAVAR
ncbi:NADPH-dependent F420 reductase [Promicromonospora citrea]|uniref:Dinucleotide-binding protein n=1 Tax=Promicromonospora citrea TaxID=43677 RepID=A0A8H9L6A7_9MICO|nr:diguanylate cyclase [Promicromonospora citrea]NNH51714.1 diguanylate cyclase [Promicromonospora citrea]GGM42550.1 dinucleotide-binding protein [Promicromonospora citrea]